MTFEHFSVLVMTIPLAFVVGLFVGSFLNVVIYRTPLGLSVSTPRSFCPTCDRQLAWWENVPVVSWLGLRGRCHTCHQAISIRYPMVELATGAVFALTAWAWHGTIWAAAYCVLAASMLAISLIAYGGQQSPLSVAAIGTGLAEVVIVLCGAWQHRWTPVAGSLVGTALAVAAFSMLVRLDPDGDDLRGHGRSALLVVGCWAGGLGVGDATVAVSSGIIVYLVCLVSVRALDRQTAAAGASASAPIGVSPSGHPVVTYPLVTGIAVAMVVSLVVGT